MKTLIWLVLGVAVVYYLYGGGNPGFAVPQQTPSERQNSGISKVEFMTLFNEKKPFAHLARDDYYTVIEVYLDTCAICKRLESGYQPFLEKRRDVIIKKVHFPESGINISISSQQEAEEIQSRMESYRVCGTPHVEIYGPDKILVSADNCGSKQGTNFLRQWISSETGISRRML